MKLKITVLTIASILIANLAVAQSYAYNPEDESYSESCTSIMVAKNASDDGSVMTSHTCDSNYRTWLKMEARKYFKLGDMEPIRWGLLNNESSWDNRKIEIKGEIPAPDSTFAFLNTAYPCLNEKQLAMGETTTVGRSELVNKKGLFLIEELQRIGLERTTNARDAIQLIGTLAEQFGYGDNGECLTIADKNEVWHFEIYGTGKKGKPSALWVAQRIPDNHIGVSANIPRIGVVDFNDPNNFMYSKDLKKISKDLGYWDGKSEYKFYKVVSTKKPFLIREYFILNTLAPSLGLKYDAEELPFSVKPDKKVTAEDLTALFRETYEDTEWDMRKNLFVEVKRRKRDENGKTINYKDTVSPMSNFMPADMRSLLNKLDSGVCARERTIAVIQCSYSHIIKLRNWLPDEVGGVAYFSYDNPAQSPRMPIYSGTTKLPSSFEICGQHRYREDAGVWAFRETNRVATINWEKTRGILEPQILHLENLMFSQSEAIEKEAAQLIKDGKIKEGREVLTNHTHDFASLAIQRWQELKAEVWMVFARGM